MAYNNGLHEILSTRLWDIHPTAHQEYRLILEKNILGHIPFVMEAEKFNRPYILSSRTGFLENVYVGDPEYIQWRNDLTDDDRIINVVSVSGPVTRNGGACSYGSKEIRDMLKEYAELPQVIGHIFVIDSPGGSAASKYDFEQGIECVRSAGQKTIALVDGMACSAAYALAALCDEVYYVHPANDVGCIGTMCGFYIQKHGDKNAVTGETYVEIYDEDSPYKNRKFRDAAEGDFESLKQSLHKSGIDFRTMVKEHRNGVTEEQLKGDTYSAGEVEGSLVDGMNDMQGCIDSILQSAGLSREPKPGKTPELEPAPEPEAPSGDSKKDNSIKEDNNLNPKEMKKYSMIQAALGVHALESEKNDALYLNAELCESLETYLGICERNADILDAKMTEIGNLNASIEQMKSDHANALANLKSDNQKALDDLKAEHENSVKGLNDRIAELQNKLDVAEKDLESKEAELKEFGDSGIPAQVPAAPSDNGLSAKTEDNGRVCKPGMNAAQRREALQKQWGRPNC